MNTTIWLRSDHRAAYPSLEAAGKALRRSAPGDTFSLTRHEVPEGQLKSWNGLLTNSEGRIERSTGKRLLDGLCGTGSALGSLACLGLGLFSFGTVIGALLVGPQLFKGSFELGEQAVRQIHRGISGRSDEATFFAQNRARDKGAGVETAQVFRGEGNSIQARMGTESWNLAG